MDKVEQHVNLVKINQLWAPWRMELIKKPKKSPCFFCDFIPHPDNDKENLILERNKYTFVIMNKYPYSNGHLMIVPYKHSGNMEEHAIETYEELMASTVKWQTILKNVVNAQGFNIGINIGAVAGAGVAEHIHIHIVPRWLGDTNFMPVLGDVKIINQSLEELYEKLYAKVSQ
ncbi:MAG TPA: HIT domain-containing protein [Planctomycetota bacterium]|jgi:ATP adenylyltransferase|nr:HIT domain-containing protein [Planctomycetota bacterium]HPY75206.1 HIT domain-containing protein [Planctomycetota bacterium]HQB00488.1 HIT domain-containing protein [Planctomycetota bacterium]HRU51040.1 HIT domain-containing protein [Planctomycetota bacterium]